MDINSKTIDLSTPYSALMHVRTVATDIESKLNYPNQYMNHVLGVALYGEHVINSITENDTTDDCIDSDLMRLCFICHDIGRPITDYSIFDIHELLSGQYLKLNGYAQIADIVQTHFVAMEKAQLIIDEGLAPALGITYPINPNEYKQKTLAQKILTYADLSVDGEGNVIISENGNPGWAQKIDTFVAKYESIESEDDYIVHILNSGGLDRMRNICNYVEELFKID